MTVVEERQDRQLTWEGCYNVRDLGGFRTRDGHETAYRAIVRSDTPSRLTEEGRRRLLDYGIRTIVDLRLPGELQEHPNPFAQPGDHGITYINLSFVDPAATPAADFTTLANDYISMLDRFGSQVAAVMRAIAEAADGGVLIHCMAGKDRTGLICALLLELAGVPRESVAADYAVSEQCLRPMDEEWLENGPGDRGERERQIAAHAPTAEVMTEVLESLDQHHGGAEGYLRDVGVSDEDLRRLRERLVRPA